MMADIKSYWLSKTNREQYIIGILAAFTFGTILYYLLVSPMIDLFFEKKQEVSDKKALLVWMHEQAPKLVGSPVKSDLSTGLDPIGLIDKQFKPFSSLMTLSKNPNGSVQVVFKQIDFDQLLSGVLDLKNKYHISVENIDVQKLDKPGMVQASIVFKAD